MPTFWCPYCWQETAAETKQCPNCGADFARYSHLPYEEKLLLALRHPVAERRMIAIEALGRIGYAPAVSALARLLHEESDPYLLRAAIVALSQIDTPAARALIEQATRHVNMLVRHAAEDVLLYRSEAPPCSADVEGGGAAEDRSGRG